MAQRASLGGCVKNRFFSGDDNIAGCVAEVANLGSGMTFLSSDAAPPPSSWAHVAPLRLSFLICQMKVITTFMP